MTTRSPHAPGSPCANRTDIREPRQRPTCCRRGRTAAHPARPSSNGERSRLPPRPARAALAEGHLRRPGGSCRLLRARRCRQTASSQTTARCSGAARVSWWNSSAARIFAPSTSACAKRRLASEEVKVARSGDADSPASGRAVPSTVVPSHTLSRFKGDEPICGHLSALGCSGLSLLSAD